MCVLKIVYTGFLMVLVPAYWRNYGLANFLWFSDIALLTTGIALWTENSLLASIQALSVGLLETVWLVDFVGRLLTGRNVIGLSKYMWDPKIPRWLRALSLFHVVLPFLLGWLVCAWDMTHAPGSCSARWPSRSCFFAISSRSPRTTSTGSSGPERNPRPLCPPAGTFSRCWHCSA